jgi:hypothetical protein
VYYSLVHDEVGLHIVPPLHIYDRASARANPHNSCVTSEYIVIIAEKVVDSQVTMSLEKNAELICTYVSLHEG